MAAVATSDTCTCASGGAIASCATAGASRPQGSSWFAVGSCLDSASGEQHHCGTALTPGTACCMADFFCWGGELVGSNLGHHTAKCSLVQPEITLVLLAFCKVKALCCWAAGLPWGAGGAGQVSTQQKMCSHKVTQVLLAAWHLLMCGGCLRQARSDSWCTAGSCLGSKVQTWQRQFLGTLDPAQALPWPSSPSGQG